MLRSLIFFWLGMVTSVWGAEQAATPPESIQVHPGFQVELLHSAREEDGSWISMTFDDQGRLIIARDDAGLVRVVLPTESSPLTVETLAFTNVLKHCRGLLYAHHSLYVSATNTPALYRLRDLNDDDIFEEFELLRKIDYRSRYGHGTNQILLGPDQNIYWVIGNDVSFPEAFDPQSPYRDPRNDWALPHPHDAGQDNRVGFLLKTDPDCQTWTIMAGGFRNQVDAAFNADGELFTWDADMEWDAGLPWYRPTRINHVVSGGEYGWRWGTGKWAEWYPDSLPTTHDTGYGSPTGLEFGTNSDWPRPFQKKLFAADWQNGRMLAIDLTPIGATYSATSKLFLEGAPLNICDLTFGPDGQMYFITGGRGSQTGLYRVTYVGPHSPVEQPDITESQLREATKHRAVRRELEELH
ncbi:MAG: PQQ-dependent sugar dehydrogenase, partial [Planctomycetaceae bacterium]|nr:PQQ-dependent sugar dehydrogenase [Planctomycetaceae bacterium]